MTRDENVLLKPHHALRHLWIPNSILFFRIQYTDEARDKNREQKWGYEMENLHFYAKKKKNETFMKKKVKKKVK